MRLTQLSGGWLICLLAIIGVLRILPVHDRSIAQAAQLPPVVTIDVEADRIAALESSVERLTKRLADVETKLAELSQLKAPAEPPAPKSAQEQPKAQAGKAMLRMYTADWCGPCKRWLASRDAAAIASNGFSLEIVDIDTLTPAEKPASLTTIPYFELRSEDGSQFIWHRGPLTLQRLRDMERDLLSRVKAK